MRRLPLFLLLVLSAFAGCGDQAPGGAMISDVDGGAVDGAATCSTHSTTAFGLSFHNQRASEVSVYWVDEACVERYYATIAPGGRFGQQTYTGHAWRVREGGQGAGGAILKEYTPTEADLPSAVVVIPPREGEAPMLCSAPSTMGIAMRLVNQRAAPVSFYWIDYACKESHRITLGAGQTTTHDTYVGHLWRARAGAQDPGGAVLMELAPEAANLPSVTYTIAPASGESPAVCSSSGGAPVALSFENQTAGPVSLYWVGPDCLEHAYETLTAGQSAGQSSYVGHVWRVRDGAQNATGTVLKEITLADGDAPARTVSVP